MKINFLSWLKWIVIPLVIFFVTVFLITSYGPGPLCCGPDSIIKSTLSNAYEMPGVVAVSETKLSFKKDAIFGNYEVFTSRIGGYSIIWNCSAELSSVCSSTGSDLKILTDFQAKFSACCKNSGICYAMLGEERPWC